MASIRAARSARSPRGPGLAVTCPVCAGLRRSVTRWPASQDQLQDRGARRRCRRCSPVNRLRPGETCAPSPEDPGALPQTPALPRRVGKCRGPPADRATPCCQISGRPSRDTPPLTDSRRPGRSDDARSTRDPDSHDVQAKALPSDGPPTSSRLDQGLGAGLQPPLDGRCRPGSPAARRARPTPSAWERSSADQQRGTRNQREPARRHHLASTPQGRGRHLPARSG